MLNLIPDQMAQRFAGITDHYKIAYLFMIIYNWYCVNIYIIPIIFELEFIC